MSDLSAEEIFHQLHISKTAFHLIAVEELRELCNKYGIAVVGTGHRPVGAKTKLDYIKAILSFISS